MSYCLNPVCPNPQNLDEAAVCQCGAKLRLRDCYLPLKAIGQGGFGRTFLAVDQTQALKPLCVIKQFFPQALGTDSREKAAELFRQEALRLKELGHHAQIPNLLDFLEQEGQQYLIQEFIDGRNLEQELAEQGRFSETQIHQLLNDLLPVLQFIHDRQVIHRDIKPANIIRRSADQKLVLVDLGAAKCATGTALARTGTVIGSAEFTAPEQTRGKAVFASDIYSLGATCIHLLTQISPFDLFDSSDDRWVWRDYLDQPVSHALGQVLDKMLHSGTKRRYRSANQVLEELNQAAQPYSSAAQVPRSPARRPESQDVRNQHFGRTDSLIAAFEPETRSRQWDIVDGKARIVPSHPDLKSERGGSIAPIDDSGGRSLPVTKMAYWEKKIDLSWLKTIILLLFCLLSVVVPSILQNQGRSRYTTPVVSAPVVDDSIRTLTSSGKVYVSSIALSPDGKTLASASISFSSANKTEQIELWNPYTGKRLGTLRDAGKVNAISPDGQTLVSGSSNGQIKFWNLQSKRLIQTIQGHSGEINSVVISPDDQTLVTSGFDDGTIRLWNLQTGARIRTLRPPNNVTAIVISPDSQILASTSNLSKSITTLWNLRTGKLTQTLQGDVLQNPNSFGQATKAAIAISSNGRMLAAGGCGSENVGGTIDIWNLQTGKRIRTLIKEQSGVRSVAFSPNGKILAGGGGDGIVKLWNLATGEQIRIFQGARSEITSVVFSPDGKTVIAGTGNGKIKIWSVE